MLVFIGHEGVDSARQAALNHKVLAQSLGLVGVLGNVVVELEAVHIGDHSKILDVGLELDIPARSRVEFHPEDYVICGLKRALDVFVADLTR